AGPDGPVLPDAEHRDRGDWDSEPDRLGAVLGVFEAPPGARAGAVRRQRVGASLPADRRGRAGPAGGDRRGDGQRRDVGRAPPVGRGWRQATVIGGRADPAVFVFRFARGDGRGAGRVRVSGAAGRPGGGWILVGPVAVVDLRADGRGVRRGVRGVVPAVGP